MDRCFNRASKDFPAYGGRGITVCERWLNVEKFFADMGDRPAGLSLERNDPNGNYEPSNCRWATPLDQGRTKRNNRKFVIDGEELHWAEISRRYGISETTFMRRIDAGMSPDQAAKAPARGYSKTLTASGVTKTLAEWASEIGVTRKTIQNRIDAGWTPDQTVSTPGRTK